MARTTRLLGLGLAALGVPFLAYALALLAWQAFIWLHTGTWTALPSRLLVDPTLLEAPRLSSIARFIPSFDWGWANHPQFLRLPGKLLAVLLDRVHLGLLAAAVGYALIEAGRQIMVRQAEILEWQARQRADRMRRVAEYCKQ